MRLLTAGPVHASAYAWSFSPLLVLAIAGCPDASDAPRAPNAPTTASKARPDSRFLKIRSMLYKEVESRERSIKLYPLVAPICEDDAERKTFVEDLKWSASFATREVWETKSLAADVVDHVATTCFRTKPAETLKLLADLKAAVPDVYRFDLTRARLAAASGDLADAEASARAAKEAGSIHAIALLANIQAQRARDAGVGYRAGMLDQAITTVAAEPDGQWPLVDLAAVLSTRARLLTERAVWEDPDAAKRSMLEANAAYLRLSKPPFIENIRQRAEDVLCFNAVAGGVPSAASDSARDVCAATGSRTKNLGAARVGAVDMSSGFDAERLAALDTWGRSLGDLAAGRVVVVVVRGDESELIEWARPAARVLALIRATDAKFIAVDRTRTPRARALFQRMLALGGVEPDVFIDADSTFAMPCLTAILAKRQTPSACPFDRERVRALERMATVRSTKLPSFVFALLIGRDLDAEIDDLHLYDLQAVLMSFRQSRMEKGIDVWLKSVSDVFLAAPPQ